jgi:hypothetical protein
MLRALPLALAACTATAAAQDLPPMGSLEPCLETHFDPARYEQALTAIGWVRVDAAERDTALDMLTDAILPVSDKDFAWTDADADDKRAQQRAGFDRLTAGRQLYVRQGEALFIGGSQAPDGRRRVECYMAARTGGVIAEIIEMGLTRDFAVTRDGIVRAALGPHGMPDGATFWMAAARADLSGGLAAPLGIFTRLELTAN